MWIIQNDLFQGKFDIVSSVQVSQIRYSKFSIRDKHKLETMFFFCFFSYENSDDDKESYHTTGPKHKRYSNNFFMRFSLKENYFSLR